MIYKRKAEDENKEDDKRKGENERLIFFFLSHLHVT